MKTLNFWKIGTVLLGLLLIGGTGLYLAFTFISFDANWKAKLIGGQPVNVVAEFHETLCNADIENAQKYISNTVQISDEFLKLGLGAGARECKEKQGFEKIIVSNEKIENEKAEVTGQILYKDKTKSPFNMKLYLEKDIWKIAYNGN